MNIFVKNIAFKANSEDIEQLFKEFGKVSSAKVIKDKQTGRSKGFGFVEMDNDQEAKDAIDSLNGYEFMGRDLMVVKARPKES